MEDFRGQWSVVNSWCILRLWCKVTRPYWTPCWTWISCRGRVAWPSLHSWRRSSCSRASTKDSPSPHPRRDQQWRDHPLSGRHLAHRRSKILRSRRQSRHLISSLFNRCQISWSPKISSTTNSRSWRQCRVRGWTPVWNCVESPRPWKSNTPRRATIDNSNSSGCSRRCESPSLCTISGTVRTWSGLSEPSADRFSSQRRGSCSASSCK